MACLCHSPNIVGNNIDIVMVWGSWRCKCRSCLPGGGSGDVDLIRMGLSASCGVADLKLGLRYGDLELHLFSLSGSDLGWSIDLDPVCRRFRSRFRSVSIDMDSWSSVLWGDLILIECFYLDRLKRRLFFSPAIVTSIYLLQLIISLRPRWSYRWLA